MPKKFANENTKAVAARGRKNAAKDAVASEKQKQIEDAYWKEDCKELARKQQRKEELDRKRREQLKKKAEVKVLLEEEVKSIKATSSKPAPASKLTRAQIDTMKITKSIKEKAKMKTEAHLDVPLIENLNRFVIDGEHASTVSEAITILSPQQEQRDKHPEKRMKAAYTTFEAQRLKELKDENPTLRLSQLKQMIFKDWQKSSENPLNNEL